VVVTDLAMPVLNRLDAARKLKQTLPEVKLIFLTMNEDPDFAIQAMREGASGYLLKKSGAAELVQAIFAASKVNRM
jgi:DNA-binding NarL/FixJ family response regulator